MAPKSRLWPLLLLSSVLQAGCGKEPATVRIDDGALRGESDGDTEMFLGIPFARPPLGSLRFAPPEAVVPWSGERDSTAFGPSCAQLKMGTSTFDASSSEDCLYLNVWAPARSGSFPVMVWLPGGGYVIGAGSEPLYDGQHLSSMRDVVVVTVNYRLASFGFLGHAAIRESEGFTGNYGLLDQRAALSWVRRNIAAFHGDPNNVTLFGESAGAGSTCMHLLSPGSQGLFDRAILESAPCTSFDHPTRDESEAQGADLSRALGCDGDNPSVVDCLRRAPTLDVLLALPPNDHFVYGKGVAWWPAIDGVVVEDQPAALLAQGSSASIPVIIGANADEATAFFSDKASIASEADARSILAEYFPAATIEQILGFYPLGSDPQAAMVRAFSDMFICDARRVARMRTSAGGTTYEYHFTFGFYDALIGGGAFHTAELPFAFGNAMALPILPAGIPLKNAIQGYWSNFARTGDPNGGGRPQWSPYDLAEDEAIRLDLSVGHISHVRREACDFWDVLRAPP